MNDAEAVAVAIPHAAPMSFVAGVDSGSTTTKLVLLKDGQVDGSYVVRTGANSRAAHAKVMDEVRKRKATEVDIRSLVATGYGRHNIEGAARQVSEITCQAKAVNWLYPTARVIIDIGGQDFKIIEVDGRGHVTNFAMNEKCAAGTGRYLELMAGVFAMTMDDFSLAAGSGETSVEISSFCTVFAETEVVGHIARGTDGQQVVAGIYNAVAKRVCSLAKRYLAGKSEVVFVGGVARNAGMVRALGHVSGCAVLVPPQPQITGALGAALFALEGLR